MLKRDPDEARSADWPRRLQAIRGHTTHELLEELRPLLKDVQKESRRRGGATNTPSGQRSPYGRGAGADRLATLPASAAASPRVK